MSARRGKPSGRANCLTHARARDIGDNAFGGPRAARTRGARVVTNVPCVHGHKYKFVLFLLSICSTLFLCRAHKGQWRQVVISAPNSTVRAGAVQRSDDRPGILGLVTAIERWAAGVGLIALRRRCDPLRLATQREHGIRLRSVDAAEQRAVRGRISGLHKAFAARSTTASSSTSPSFSVPTIRKKIGSLSIAGAQTFRVLLVPGSRDGHATAHGLCWVGNSLAGFDRRQL
jgi:hypothetical protein